MRVIYLRKYTWFLIICFAVVFIFGNIVLFNKFMSKSKLEDGKQALGNMGKEIIMRKWKNDPNSPLGKVVEMIERERKQESLGGKTERPRTEKATDALGRHSEEDVNKRLDQSEEKVSETLIEANNRVDEPTTGKTDDKATSYDHVKHTTVHPGVSEEQEQIAVLVISCNRPEYVKRCIDRLFDYRPSAETFPIIVSQDCGHQQTANVIKSYGDKIQFFQQPDLGDIPVVPANMKHFMGYYKISRHYKFALGMVFDNLGYGAVVVVEDDLDIAPDFFDYFEATRPLLTKDPTLWCVSAWNDNGKEGLVQSNDILFRTDFFPGLGWMLTKSIWNELKPKWPLGFWDDWIRQPEQRKNRACIRPDIPRTKTYGKIGVSRGQFYEQHLKYIKLNDKKFPFLQTDLSYLIKENFDPRFIETIAKAPTVTIADLGSKLTFDMKEVKLLYSSQRSFERLAKAIGAMTDLKSGVARASYKGVVTVMYKRTRLYLVPSNGIL